MVGIYSTTVYARRLLMNPGDVGETGAPTLEGRTTEGGTNRTTEDGTIRTTE